MTPLDPLHDLAPASSLLAAVTAPGAPPQLLLVDDEPRILGSLCELLRHRGFILSTASTGKEALRKLSQEPFDLVILDLRLPDISGHEIMDFMNARQIGANVIVTSGDAGIEAAIGALKRGAYDYLRKPYSREELLKAVHNALQQRRLESENRQIAAQLEYSERHYRYLVDSSPDIIFTLSAKGVITFVNHRVEPLLGYKREELVGRHYSELVHELDMERANFVFGDKKRDHRWSRNVELRLKSNHVEDEARIFIIELMTVTAIDRHKPGAVLSENTDSSGVYGVARDITESKRADELIAYQAYHDILTDLPNRLLFKDRLNLALLQAKRKKNMLAVLFVDLDRFKVVNDSLGHPVGDELLQQAALRLRACLRQSDTLSRFGGDEFTVGLPELEQPEDASRMAQKLLQSLRQPFVLGGHALHISASIGVAVFPGDGDCIDELVRKADLAMHSIKAKGRNGHAFFNADMQDLSSERITLEHDLHLALSQGELEMYYQPQVDVASGKVIGVEALMRWNHPRRGFFGGRHISAICRGQRLHHPAQ